MTATPTPGAGIHYEMSNEEFKRFLMKPAELAAHHGLKKYGYTFDYSRTIYEGEPEHIAAFMADMQARGQRLERYDARTIYA